MNTSIRTLSDSSNKFLPTLWERFHPFDDFLARELCSLWPLNLYFFYLFRSVSHVRNHLLKVWATLHPIVRFDQESFARSEEHTSELQSLAYLVCRLLLEKKKKIQLYYNHK